MKRIGSIAVLIGLAFSQASAAAPLKPDPPKVCSSCAAWNVPHEPFKVFGNTYYVGTAELSSILIASKKGLILIDGALPQSAPLIAENIRKLGFRVEDIHLIVNSHAHHDHVGGISALQRASGAVVAASPASVEALKKGGLTADDPQFGFGPEQFGFPAIPKVIELADRETMRVGDNTITPHFTPGHTPGGTSWTWNTCEGKRCVDVVYADSLSAVSAPGYSFADNSESLRASIAQIAALPCDVLLTPHPEFFGMAAKLQRRLLQPEENPFIDPKGCKEYADAAKGRLEKRIEEERATPR